MTPKFNVQPQMVEGHVDSDDGKQWDLTLRDGLKFHDGAPVLARDCVATIQRFAKRDPFGQALMARTDEISAPSDKVIRFRLKKPFPLLPNALAQVYCAIMPERLAKTDADEAGHRGDRQRPVQVRRRRAHSRPARRLREERRLRAARGRHAEFQCRAEDRLHRSRRVEVHSRSRDRVGGADAGRDRLVGEPDDRPDAADEAATRTSR